MIKKMCIEMYFLVNACKIKMIINKNTIITLILIDVFI